MAKYVVLLIILIGAGSLFLYATQTVEAPAQTPAQENLFGEGSDIVGSLDDGNPTSGGTQTGSTTGSTGTTGGTTSVISRATLAVHNKQSDCWVAYKGVVYDITSWLPRHPGSAAAIAPYCGKAEEFATAFNKQHGTSKEGRLKQEGTVKGTLGN